MDQDLKILFRKSRFSRACLIGIVSTLMLGTVLPQDCGDLEIDRARVRELRDKVRQRKQLTSEEQRYLKCTRAIIRERQDRQGRPSELSESKSVGLVPLTDMADTEKYKGQEGGLYGRGANNPPPAHLQAALSQAARIRPLDSRGRPHPEGKIGLISVGMSNTSMEFSQFVELAESIDDVSPHLVIVNGAQGGQEAARWVKAGSRNDRDDQAKPWGVLMHRLKSAGVDPLQVQVAWIKQARPNPFRLGEFPQHSQDLKNWLGQLVSMLKTRFPNLQLAYLSSRIYAGYASTPLNPEPYAYESAFTVRDLILDQIQGSSDLNYDSSRGPVKSPLLLWGPYLWADGVKGRGIDDLVWLREDLARDGTHPSRRGERKVAELLLEFFRKDPTSRTWFLKGESLKSG